VKKASKKKATKKKVARKRRRRKKLTWDVKLDQRYNHGVFLAVWLKPRAIQIPESFFEDLDALGVRLFDIDFEEYGLHAHALIRPRGEGFNVDYLMAVADTLANKYKRKLSVQVGLDLVDSGFLYYSVVLDQVSVPGYEHDWMDGAI
jgi:hypothetical protein